MTPVYELPLFLASVRAIATYAKNARPNKEAA